VTGHLKIGDGVMVGAQGGVIADVDAGQIVSGTYAMPHATWLRVQATLPTLPEMRRTVKRLEARVEELVQRSSRSTGSKRATRSKPGKPSRRTT
jgi:UDP-3-O-[3-hydroxymyristoyl] glucosamine N-acyltransferase